MNYADAMVHEFLHESTITKKLLERLPEKKLSWKPHEKSMPLGRLATHITEIPQWGEVIIKQDAFDMGAVDYTPKQLESRSEILEFFQENIDKFTETLKGTNNDAMFAQWQLKEGEKVLVDLPRAAAIRSFILSHIVHHRGQLSVYLRENDVPVPSIYGPSADEQS